MNRQDIQEYLSDPVSLNDESEADLKKTIGSYPYCSLLYMLLARSHQNRKSAVLQDVIEKAAACSPDREGLYRFLQDGDRKVLKTRGQEKAAGETVAPDLEKAVSGEAVVERAVSEEAAPEESVPDEVPSAETSAESDVAGAAPAEAAKTMAEEVVPEEAGVAETPAETVKAASAEAPAAKSDSSGVKKPNTETGLAKKAAGSGEIALNIDDRLPRTFTFWLRRIRQVTMDEEVESAIHSIRLDTDASRATALSDGLEKNYYNELLYRNTAEEYQNKVKVEYDLKKKEDRIIAKFIEEDPQVIKPVVNIKTTESSAEVPEGEEDSEEDASFISETLAKIYIDQNLTAKAIQVYEKLSLKFPEKSAYFAGLIEKLRK